MTKRRLNLRNVVKIGVACLAVTMMFLGCKDNPDEPEIGMTYHDNDVNFYPMIGDDNGNFTENSFPRWYITGGKFTITAHGVTQDQDPAINLWNGKVLYMNENTFTIRVGRKASQEVANSFNAICSPEHNTFGHTAGELNFWVKGTLELNFYSGDTYTFPNTVLAQGHSGAANNWWFGNDTMTNSQEPILLYDPYSRFQYYVPIPVYGGEACYGLVSPMEDPTLVFKFKRGDGLIWNPPNTIDLVGVYTRAAPAEPW